MRVVMFLPHLGVTGGLGVHCRALLEALATCGEDEGLKLDVICPDQPRKLFPLAGLDDTWEALVRRKNLNLHPIKWPEGLSLADCLDEALLGLVKRLQPELFYASYYTGLKDSPCPQAITFHDAGFLEFPDVFGDTASKRRQTLALIGPSVNRLLCVSSDARDRICRLLPFAAERTEVVWHALYDAPATLEKAMELSAIQEPLWAGGDSAADWGDYIFLPVGAATGFNRVRKNVPLGVRAFRAVSNRKLKLVIASTGTLNNAMLGQLIDPYEQREGSFERGIWHSGDDRILILPNLDRLPFLRAMAHAKAVLYPTRYEGFGLPSIEAMALGTPLIAGNATSVPEVVGDAGILVPPDDQSGFTSAMEQVFEDRKLREALIARGHERLKLFTPVRMGRRMLEVFQGLMK